MNLNDDDTVDELPARQRQVIPAADRELLELAGRALGAVRVEDVEGENWVDLHFVDGTVLPGWNPLLFYGDTFELQVQLHMTVRADAEEHRSVAAWRDDDRCTEHWDQHTDARAATARAITRAAAEVGKQHS